MSAVKIIETPRDGIQGIKKIIPTKEKLELINSLLQVGFEGVEVGSFVSPKAIPQLKDTIEIIDGLNLQNTSSKVMVLTGNIRGAETASKLQQIDQVIFPYSVSGSFLIRNINTDLKSGWVRLLNIKDIVQNSGKELIVYLTMGFGNPYGDDWSISLVVDWAGRLIEEGVQIIPLSDITGEADPDKIYNVYSTLMEEFPETEFGLHLHSSKDGLFEKLDASWKAGCRRYDTVSGGLGGCPMTGKEMLTNLDTWDLITFLKEINVEHGLNKEVLRKASNIIVHFVEQ